MRSLRAIVFGSTGGTGRATLSALATAGHRVTAFARNPEKLPVSESITVVRGDVMDPVAAAAAIAGQDLAIVSLGNSQNPFATLLGAPRTTPADVCEAGTRHIVAGMRSGGVRRLLVVSAFGVGDTRDRLPWTFKLFYRTLLREHMADKEKQEVIVKQSGLDWTIVQPVGLTDEPATGTWLANDKGIIRKQQMSRADVAAFLVSIAEDTRYYRATVALSG
jgi:uncharacterized protein YbjT (DUF2867 family)